MNVILNGHMTVVHGKSLAYNQIAAMVGKDLPAVTCYFTDGTKVSLDFGGSVELENGLIINAH